MATIIKAHQLGSELFTDQTLSPKKARINSRHTNYLSLEVRPIQVPFDDDGPGHLSPAGPRHDNDHINIRDIQILPTADEILAVDRNPYIPKKNLHESHHLQAALPRLLDTQFRQLRYDNTEYFRDVCYSAAQKLVSEDLTPYPDYVARQESPAGNRYFLYRDAQFEETLCDEKKGLLIRCSYACPSYLRGRQMHHSGRFQEGMLCALIGINKEDGALSVTFFEVHQCQSTDSMKGRGVPGTRAAVQLSFAQQDDHEDILRIARYGQGLASGLFILVEFPRALYAGFYWCLKRLQEMNTFDIAFANQIAPAPNQYGNGYYTINSRAQNAEILPPAYTTREGFTLDLSRVTNSQIRFPPSALRSVSRPLLIDFLRRETTLDDGQAVAFAESLSRELAFTQGPPGTGKTFLGIALARTIVASRVGQSPKPILIVCLTNHALDSFLGGLIETGETSIARIGRGSREEWAKKYNLHSLGRKHRFDESDVRDRLSALRRVRGIANDLESLCKDLNEAKFAQTLHWHTVKTYLRTTHKQVYDQLATTIETTAAQAFVFDYWSGGGDLENLEDLKTELEFCVLGHSQLETHTSAIARQNPIPEALSKIARHAEAESSAAGKNNVWRLSLTERIALLDLWKVEVDRENLIAELVTLHFDLHQANLRHKGIRQRMDKECLLKQNIIGLTTTACASNWMLLKSLDLEVVICEEAAEVMEAHTLCTLLPSVEHAIFIGDPLQLRPDVDQPGLSLETRAGMEYRLDESLFERFMHPQDPALHVMPTSHLSVQRRMHPEISLITKLTYPYLIDHEQTLDNPRPVGVFERAYWLDHDYPETCPGDISKSYSNSYEVDMIVSFVRYLIRGNGYTLGQIAVLTPYNGQLAALKIGLKSTCAVWLNEKDRLSLIEDGLIEEKADDMAGKKEDVQMSGLLRIATIDNFQGEEARIVILSTVRSGGGTGFLKTRNRINVACSRARDGFYIIGSARTLQAVPVWRSIIDIFIMQNRIGSHLRVGCIRHPDTYRNVSQPQDFDAVGPCQWPCGNALPCGHPCEELCHPLELHEVFKCQKPCQMTLDCGHECRKACHEICGKCTQPLWPVTLDCGHTVDEMCPGVIPECKTIVQEVKLLCGHIRSLKCSQIIETFECDADCKAVLDCGHQCTGVCAVCRGAEHTPCSIKCGKLLSCRHFCEAECHFQGHETPCPPCCQPCQRSCSHGHCQNSCSMICDPCIRPHLSHCTHGSQPSVICSLPPDALPCNEPCTRALSCGHLCPSLCGERCLEGKCPECLTKQFSSRTLILVPRCGHVLDVESLDRHVYNDHNALIDPTGHLLKFKLEGDMFVPTCVCGGSLAGVNRYAVLHQMPQANDNIDRLFAKIGRKLNRFGKSLRRIERNLLQSWDQLCESIRPNPLAARENVRLIGGRCADLVTLKKDVVGVRDDIIVPFQRSMTRLTKVFPHLIPKYNFCFDLRAEILLCRIRTVLLEDSIKMAYHISPLPDPSLELERMANLLLGYSLKECTDGRKSMKNLIEQASKARAPCVEAELRLQYLGLTHLQHFISKTEISTTTAEEIQPLITLCKRYPETAGSFLSTAQEFRTFLSKQHRAIPSPVIYTGKTLAHEHLWGEHSIGHLTVCENGHPFSTETFRGCPECGKEVLFIEEETQKYGGMLKESRFLKWMNGV